MSFLSADIIFISIFICFDFSCSPGRVHVCLVVQGRLILGEGGVLSDVGWCCFGHGCCVAPSK